MAIAGEILISAVADALAAGATAIAFKAARRLGALNEVKKAIRTTEKLFGEPASNALRAWTESQDFEKVARLCAARGVTDQEITESFRLILRHSGMATASIEDSREILLTFTTNWKAEALRDDQTAVLVHDELEALRIDDLGTRVASQIAESEARVIAEFKKMNSALGEVTGPRNGSLTPVMPDISLLHQPYREQVNLARQFLDSGKLKAARDLLAELRRSTHFYELPEHLKFSTLTNLGIVQLRLGEIQDGEATLHTALELKPFDPVALSNTSVAALRQGRFEDALNLAKRALEADPNEQRARLNLIAVLDAMDRRSEAEVYLLPVEEWSGETNTLVAVGQMYAGFGRTRETEAVARRAVEMVPENVSALGLLAAAILANHPVGLETPSRERMDEADRLLTTAIGIAIDWDDHSIAAYLYTNRAVLRGMQGRLDEGVDDAKQAVFHDPTNQTARLNKGLFHLQRAEYEAAVAELVQVVEGEEVRNARLPLAVAAFKLGKYELVRSVLSPALDEPEERDFPDAADLLLQGAEEAGDLTAVESIVQRLHELRTTHCIAAIPIARHTARSGNGDTAVRLLDEARAASRGEEQVHLACELALAYFRDSRFAESAAVFETFVRENTNRFVVQRFIIALLNSGDWRNALQWARRVRENGPPVPIISEIEAMVLDAVGDAAGARELYHQLALADTTNIRLRLREITADVRLNNHDDARAKIEALSLGELGDDPRNFLTAADLRQILGLGGIMPLAYRALQIGYAEDEIHSAYLGFFLRNEEEVGDPAEVVADCEVTLDTNDGPVSYMITSDSDEAKREGFFSYDSAIAAKLRGHRVDETVTIYQSEFGKEQVGTIRRIRSKYAATFTRIMREYPVRFPDSRSVQVGEGDPERVFELIRSADRRRREIEKLYRFGLVGVGGLADLMNRSEIETLGMLITDPNSRVMAFTGDQVAADSEEIDLRASEGVTFDLSTLVTIHLLEVAEAVKVAFPRFSAATQTLDALNEYLAVDGLSREEGVALSVAADGDSIVAADITPQQKAARRAFVSGIRDFVMSGSLLPARRTAELTRDDRERLIRRVGRVGLASIAVAAEHGNVLCVDDLVAKRVAHEQWSVKTASTSSLLAQLRRLRSISDDKFVSALTKLATFDYFFLRFSGDDLYEVLVSGELSLRPELTRLLASLAGPDCDLNSAAVVLATFIRRAVLTLNVPQLRTMVVDLAATAIMRGRDPGRALNVLRRALESTFLLIPAQLHEVKQTLALWERRALLFS